MPKRLPILGVGVEYTRHWDDDFVRRLDAIDTLEVIPENFYGRPRNMPLLDAVAAASVPMTFHGVELSIGTAEPPKEEHLREFIEIARAYRSSFVSEHLAMTEAGGVEVGQLTPLPFTKKMVEVVARNIDTFQQRFGVPFLIENITNAFIIPGAEMSEPAFINAIMERADCDLLLDLNNVLTNGRNHGYDPYDWLKEIAIEKTGLIHLAGGHEEDTWLVDSHDRPIPEAEWAMLEWTLARAPVNCVIVERTGDHPPYDEFLESEIGRARAMWERLSLPQLAGAVDLRPKRETARVA